MRENETSKCPRPQNVQAWRIPESSKQFWNSWSKENASICFHIPMALMPFVWPTRPAVPASSGENPANIPDQGHAMHLVWMKLCTTNEFQYPWLMNVFGWHWQPPDNRLCPPNNRQANINHSTSPIRSRPRARNVLSLTTFWRVVLDYTNKRKDKGRTSTSRPEMAWALRKVQRDWVWFVTFGHRLASFSDQRKSRWHPVHKAKHKLIIESWMAPDFVPSWGATPLLTSEHSAAKTVDAKSRINRWQLTCIARSHQFEVLEMYSTTK